MTSPALAQERARAKRLEAAFAALAADYESLVEFAVADFARDLCLARLERLRAGLEPAPRLHRRRA